MNNVDMGAFGNRYSIAYTVFVHIIPYIHGAPTGSNAILSAMNKNIMFWHSVIAQCSFSAIACHEFIVKFSV